MNGNNHLLLVDDEALNRDMLSRRLEHHGFRVDVAADGPSALQYIGTHRPDLVLLDIMMPGMTGVEVLQELRATYAPDQLPVIMVTALKDSDKVVEALNLGANDYITKPVDFPVAMARIHGQLARKAAESALRESEERYALAARTMVCGTGTWLPGRSTTPNAGRPFSGTWTPRSGRAPANGSRACTPRTWKSSGRCCGRHRPAAPAGRLSASTACGTGMGPIDGCIAAARRYRMPPVGSSGWLVR